MKHTICFGEILLRLSPPGHLRLPQALPGGLEAAFAGAEANVAVAVAQLGGAAEFVTALPVNAVAGAALAALRAARVKVGHVVQADAGRCGVYFVETGASQRGGLVVYDREGSTFSLIDGDRYAWPQIFAGAGWFHTTGISAGVSRVAAEATLTAVRAARAAGVTVSCDLNFRRKLWRWETGVAPEELARRTLTRLLPDVDVLIGNAFDLAGLLGEAFDDEDTDGLDRQIALAGRVAEQFPRLKWIAITLRRNHSASRNRWGALLYQPVTRAVFAAPLEGGAYTPYTIDTIVDRVGTGDAFAGALIFALQTPELGEPARAIAFATAAGCLAHSIKGDFFYCTRAEVEGLADGNGAGHLSR